MLLSIIKKQSALTLLLALLAFPLPPSGAATAADEHLSYPQTEQVEQVDDYHGVKVKDPYRWLEDLNSQKTKDWVQAENKVTFDYLSQIPVHQKIRDQLNKLWNFEKYSAYFRCGQKYFYKRNSGLQNQDVLYVTDNVSKPGTALIDPNKLSQDGTVALSGLSITDDAKLVAYSTSSAGSDWQEWHVRDVASGKDLPDLVQWSKFSEASWTKDDKGFFYGRYEKPNEATKLQDSNYFQKLYYHRLGTKQSQDRLVYERKDQKEWQFEGDVSDDGRYLIITITHGTDPNTRVYYKDLFAKNAPVVKLLDKNDARYSFVNNEGSKFWFNTNLDAPRGRLIAIDLHSPSIMHEVIPQSADTIDDISLVGTKFFVSYMKDAYSVEKLFSLNGAYEKQIPFPTYGTAHGFAGKRSYRETFYSFVAFTMPATIYRYDIVTGKTTVVFQPKVAFNATDYTSEQVFYTSKDGTKVPMFISYRKGMKKGGNNPCYLYAYGGFDIPITPFFSVANLVWMEMGGVFAVPNIRGGGEYGEAWHQAGMKAKKQNVFDDFLAAAQWLIDNKYTNTSKLACGGASNGGLLIGAAITQRPDLFAAALPAVGVMDMLRFHKYTIGWAWTQEYGSSDDPQYFPVLFAYSPYHNIKSGTTYPATLITTGDHDDRVVPAHSFKFAAALQKAQKSDAPVLIRIETKAGHGFGKPTSKILEEATDKWAFLWKALAMPDPNFQ